MVTFSLQVFPDLFLKPCVIFLATISILSLLLLQHLLNCYGISIYLIYLFFCVCGSQFLWWKVMFQKLTYYLACEIAQECVMWMIKQFETCNIYYFLPNSKPQLHDECGSTMWKYTRAGNFKHNLLQENFYMDSIILFSFAVTLFVCRNYYNIFPTFSS